MKKIYLALLSTVFALGTNAQVTLTQNNCVPPIGSTFDYHVSSTATPETGGMGTGLTWDWSNFTGTLTKHTYDAASTGSDAANQPNTDLVEKVSGVENYYVSSSSGYSLAGQHIPSSARVNFTDPRETLIFPMAYGHSSSNTFSGSFSNLGAGQNFDRGGTVVLNISGSGTLILPYGTVSNVVRVISAADYGDSQSGVQLISYVDTIITFYDGFNKNFLASNTVFYSNGSKLYEYSAVADKNSVGVQSINYSNDLLKMYPNPAKNETTLMGLENVDMVSICDLSGKIIEEIEVSGMNSYQLYLSSYKSGVYVIRSMSGSNISVSRLVVE
ncbi:MAG: T9SS type A sorting domain-containing protein [Salibacteraceae bacterium]